MVSHFTFIYHLFILTHSVLLLAHIMLNYAMPVTFILFLSPDTYNSHFCRKRCVHFFPSFSKHLKQESSICNLKISQFSQFYVKHWHEGVHIDLLAIMFQHLCITVITQSIFFVECNFLSFVFVFFLLCCYKS